MPRPYRVMFAPLLVVPALACGPAQTSVPVLGPPKVVPIAKAPLAESPARWELHPAKATNLRAKLDLGAQGTLYVGDGGERWLDKSGSAAKSATSLLPESIGAVLAAPGGKGVLLVGGSGAVYTAADPLGVVEGKRAPSRPLRSVTAGKAAILGIDGDETAMRSVDSGASWQKIDLGPGNGALVQIAMTDNGTGLALFAPQRVVVTQDDGATWKPLPTPGVGARRLVLDVNGDLMLEGLDASAVLRLSPLRMERVARAPRSDGYDLALTTESTPLGYAKAVARGNGAFLGTKYAEVSSEPDDPTRWKLSVGTFGSKLDTRKVMELNGCEHVFVGGDGRTMFLACDESKKKGTGVASAPMGGGKWGPGKWSPPVPDEKAQIRVLRSEDEGKTFKDDGVTGSEHGDVGRVWITADRSLIVDGACKKQKYECYDSPPVIRPPVTGPQPAKFAKLGVPRGVTKFTALAFSQNGARAYALARTTGGPMSILLSADGGKDFTRATLPSVQPADVKHTAISATRAEPGSISVDETGAIYATAHVGNDWVLFVSTDEGTTFKGTLLPFHPDAVAMVGKRGFAYERHGKGWESADGGATWNEVSAPQLGEAAPEGRLLACGTYGCLIGDRATRIGWGAAASTVAKPTDGAGKMLAASTMKCTADGQWTSLGSMMATPTAFDADVATGMRWIGIKHDRSKGSVAAIVARSPAATAKAGAAGAIGLETKEIVLFGTGAHDTATAALPQVEGVAALRYSFKRDAPPKGSTGPGAIGPLSANQKVDVELAWYVAATGKVNHGVIRGVGPLDARDFSGSKDAPAMAVIGLLSIAQGGIHVRPLASKADAPLYFVHDSGKVDRFSWPEMPQKDAAGLQLELRVDAVRAAGRTVLLGIPLRSEGAPQGLQLHMAWANEAGTSWETRTWGIWPEIRDAAAGVAWDFTYLTGRPSIVAQWPGGGGLSPAAWGAPLKGVEADPSEVISLPTQKFLTDPPRACDVAALATPRVVAPFIIGTRHPVTVVGEGNDMVLATASAVLHGAVKDACVSAYEARAVTSAGTGTMYSALIAPDDLGHASLFKTVNGKTYETSVRNMTCAFGKDATPTVLAGAEGFTAE